MADSDVYLAYYRGVQLGDECFNYSPRLESNPALISRLHRSPLAGFRRPTTGTLTRWIVLINIIKADIDAVAAQIEQWNTLIDDETGLLEVYQGITTPVLQREMVDVMLDRFTPNISDEPSRGRIATASFEFVTTTLST